ncbi:MAG TPA: cation:dicarboxylase symporter family transporter [Gemmatimonadaceae bacterium]|nr:cation:dicarboxylase symporter family transporter [Gemmatimonadaceae bacterium]
MSPATRAFAALGAGLALGVAIATSHTPVLQALPNYLEPIGKLWVNALRMTVIPLVTTAILVGIDALPDSRSISRLAGRVLVVFLIVLLAAATLATLAGRTVFSWLNIDPASATALRGMVDATARTSPALTTTGQWIADLVPANPIKAVADGAMLQIIVLTLAFGLAIATIAAPARRNLMGSVRALNDASLVLVQWVLRATPIGVFALTVPMAATLGAAAAGAATFYVLALSGMNVAFVGLFYLVAWLAGGRSPSLFARACAPAQAVALSSRSSLASLPALLEASDMVLALPSTVSSFILPLSVATFRPGGAIGMPLGVLFVAHLYGVHLDAHQLAMVVLTAVVTTFSAPGIPSGSLLVMVPVLVSVGLPAEAVGLLIGVDAIPDTARTVTNVTGDMAVAAVMGRFEAVAVSEAASSAPAAAA